MIPDEHSTTRNRVRNICGVHLEHVTRDTYRGKSIQDDTTIAAADDVHTHEYGRKERPAP